MLFDKKEAIKTFRKLAKNGNLNRYQYLAYAFLRGTAYIKLERIINEDKFPEIGRYNFLTGLSYLVCYEVCSISTTDSEEKDILRKEIKDWLFKKYSSENREAA